MIRTDDRIGSAAEERPMIRTDDRIVGAAECCIGETRGAPAHTCYGGFVRRLTAYLIDIAAILLTTLLVTGTVAALWAIGTGAHEPWTAARHLMVGPGTAIRLAHGPLMITMRLTIPASHLVPLAAFNLAAWLYFTLQECSPRGATLGKRLLGLRVTDEHGSRLSFARANARYWCKVFSDETFGLGYLVILVTPRRQALHDLFARTLVVRSEARAQGAEEPTPPWPRYIPTRGSAVEGGHDMSRLSGQDHRGTALNRRLLVLATHRRAALALAGGATGVASAADAYAQESSWMLAAFVFGMVSTPSDTAARVAQQARTGYGEPPMSPCYW